VCISRCSIPVDKSSQCSPPSADLRIPPCSIPMASTRGLCQSPKIRARDPRVDSGDATTYHAPPRIGSANPSTHSSSFLHPPSGTRRPAPCTRDFLLVQRTVWTAFDGKFVKALLVANLIHSVFDQRGHLLVERRWKILEPFFIRQLPMLFPLTAILIHDPNTGVCTYVHLLFLVHCTLTSNKITKLVLVLGSARPSVFPADTGSISFCSCVVLYCISTRLG
jgi:hypothetical protein